MPNARKLDRVVSEFAGTDAELGIILKSFNEKGSPSPVMEATFLLQECINGRQSANGAFYAAKNVDIHGYDTDLCILFLGSWAHASFLQSAVLKEKLAEAWMLIHRVKALFSDQTQPESISFIRLIEAHLVGASGNRAEQENIIVESLNSLPPSSPRKKFAVMELASLLAMSGRLKDIESEFTKLHNQISINFKKTWMDAIRFINFIETGQNSQASALIPGLSSSVKDSTPLRYFEKYQILLNLLNTTPGNNDTTQDTNDNPEDLPDWALVLHCLLTNRLHQALRWARVCEKKNEMLAAGHELIAFNMIRAELAEHNLEAARRIMDIRHKSGNRQYIDDFFLTRIALLAGDRDSACRHFSNLLKSIDRYDADGRLRFELRLAAEMPKDALLHLIRTSGKMQSQTANPAKTSTAVITRPPYPADAPGIDRIISSTPVMTTLKKTIQQFASVDVPVLITGETGTGKELVAKALHEMGTHASRPFVAINCGAISESLLESELFGHEKGAFSGASTAHQGLFEEADDGTIFLDEIGEITPKLQVTLLRVLETGEIRPVGSNKSKKISCRIITSTNAGLQELANENRFRRDLIFRLRRLEIHLPPLRERPDDILLLTSHFLNTGRPHDVYATISAGLAAKLLAYDWPGNVRELKNAVERMRLMNSDKLYYDEGDMELHPASFAPEIPMPEKPAVHTGSTAKITGTPRDISFRQGRSKIRRLANIRELFRQHGILTRNEISRTMEISPNTATNDLKLLCDENFIEKIQPSASPRSAYFSLKQDINNKKGIR